MKVLEHPPTLPPFVRICSDCGAKLEIEIEDMTYVYDQHGDFVQVHCPVCGGVITFDASKFTAFQRSKMRG